MNTNDLAKQRTKLANQRTYLAYMRTGFAIAGIAGIFKKKWIACFGVLMIIGSIIQYLIINNDLDQNTVTNNKWLDRLPILYVVLSLGALYLQMKK